MLQSTTSPALEDKHGRKIKYLRLSVTDRCDLRCHYCLPEGFKDFSEPESWLRFDEIERVIRAFAQLGLKHLRLTGGEPLVRRGVEDLAARLAAIDGIEDLSLSTNATRMARMAGRLHQSGIRRINVSLDSLDPDKYAEITGGGKLSKVLDGLEAARDAGFQPIKINTVAMRGINEHEIDRILEYCGERGFAFRLIETMPIGDTGRSAQDTFLDLQEVKARLAKKFELIPDVMTGAGPARYYRLAGTDTRIGFITPLSQHFCETCNRVRLSAEGDIYACLGHEHRYPLREHLRHGCSDSELEAHIRKAIDLKPERHEFNEKPHQVVRFMSMTGG